jgi:NAD(P)-dependent dehydrogenase (short-subunit alcohol dehydrogenase family)
MKMAERVALVTGASSGIGRSVALSLPHHGYRVFAAGRDAERTGALRDETAGIDAWTGDITSAETCAELVSACIERFGRLDLLVNNAGIYERGTAEQTSDELWSQTLLVNLSAAFYLSRAALPHLRRTRGAIVNVASDWGLVGGREAVAYCASKGGMVLLTKAMALDHAAEGIRVNALCPGDVETPMMYRAGAERGLDDALAKAECDAGSPTGRVTTAAEVAALVVYLASDAARQITGAAIPIDGGNTAG